MQNLSPLEIIIGILSNIVIFYAIYVIIFSKQKPFYHSRWSHLIDNLDYSPTTFYKELVQELIEHNINGISTQEVHHNEGSILSGSRRYIRIKYKNYYYDICASPYGNGFFVSWWLFKNVTIGEMIVYRIPFVGKALTRLLYPETFYTIDTATMFMTYAHQSVLKVIDDITKEKGIRQPSEGQRKPLMKDFLERS